MSVGGLVSVPVLHWRELATRRPAATQTRNRGNRLISPGGGPEHRHPLQKKSGSDAGPPYMQVPGRERCSRWLCNRCVGPHLAIEPATALRQRHGKPNRTTAAYARPNRAK